MQIMLEDARLFDRCVDHVSPSYRATHVHRLSIQVLVDRLPIHHYTTWNEKWPKPKKTWVLGPRPPLAPACMCLHGPRMATCLPLCTLRIGPCDQADLLGLGGLRDWSIFFFLDLGFFCMGLLLGSGLFQGPNRGIFLTNTMLNSNAPNLNFSLDYQAI